LLQKKAKANSVLPEPVTLQGIQTDGRQFHFVVLQLNTLGSQGVHNIIWSSPLLPLFSTCEYFKGVPALKKYNSKVFSNILAFYNNGVRNIIKK
jgi:large subunit ribosomal protein L37